MKKNIKELREKYISNPPEGMTSEDIRHMSEDDLLDMDCFLNEDVFGDDEYSYAAEPPVQFRLSHLSRRSEPL